MTLISLLILGGIYLLYKVMEFLFDAVFSKPRQTPAAYTLRNIDVDSMTGIEFEKYCINLLVRSGKFSQAHMTDATNDYGADIVATDNEGVRWVFQCKRYSSNLNNRPIQEVIASMAHYKATKAAVITNSWFTDNAKVLARDNGVWLVDRSGLRQLEEQARKREEEKQTKKTEQAEQRNSSSKASEKPAEISPQERKRIIIGAVIIGVVLVVYIIVAYNQDQQAKLEAEKAHQQRIEEARIEEQNKKEIAFEDSREEPIKWINFTFSNDMKLGTDHSGDNSFGVRDVFSRSDSSVSIYGSHDDIHYDKNYDFGAVVNSFVKDNDAEVAYNVISGVSLDNAEIKRTLSDRTELIYIIASPYNVYQISATVKDREKLDSVISMIRSVELDETAEEERWEYCIAEMPYYGMPETEVENTKLGHANEREEIDMDKVKFYPTIIYKWLDENERITFYVRCSRKCLDRDTNKYSEEFYVVEAKLYDYNRKGGPIEIYAKDINKYDSIEELEEYLIKEYDLDYVDPDYLKDYWDYMKNYR